MMERKEREKELKKQRREQRKEQENRREKAGPWPVILHCRNVFDRMPIKPAVSLVLRSVGTSKLWAPSM